ncbi:hypothetical protein RFI_23390 [Reticulomyxa filosa]|uniref:Uncharacterized protein n=1 Tax=Reticulomyxa filosa TaxID=46433 RepID=X6MLN5_RETFI|nr:hypothetical protein RFI_23390 [Reticulomyxa filosa]|eukprot:ETO13980.1 hypothetical protein RFI_23390 [Reticulomyxa filosa]
MGGNESSESNKPHEGPEGISSENVATNNVHSKGIDSEGGTLKKMERKEQTGKKESEDTEDKASPLIEEEKEIELEEGEEEEERTWIERISENPKSGNVRVKFGNYLLKQDRNDEAQYQFKAALQLNGRNVAAWYSLGLLHQQNLYRAYLEKKMGDAFEYGNDAMQCYHKVLEIKMNDVETHYQLALLYLTQLQTCVCYSTDEIPSSIASFVQEVLTNGCYQDGCDYHDSDNDNGNNNNDDNDNNNANYRDCGTNEEKKTEVSETMSSHNSKTSNNKKKDNKQWGCGRYSPWYEDRHKSATRCIHHIRTCMKFLTPFDSLAFGICATYARLLYLQCLPPFNYSHSIEERFVLFCYFFLLFSAIDRGLILLLLTLT